MRHFEVALALNPHSKIAQKNMGDALARKLIDVPRGKVLTYAHVCLRMRTSADVCSRLLTYADVC
jgi:hypothetical protein